MAALQTTEQKTIGLTTHILDLAHGRPAAGVAIELYRVEARAAALVKSAVTNADGRCDAPLLAADEMRAGAYRIDFHIGDYFRGQAAGLDEPVFLDIVPVAFTLADPAAHYHVPLLVSPFGYSTYRGS